MDVGENTNINQSAVGVFTNSDQSTVGVFTNGQSTVGVITNGQSAVGVLTNSDQSAVGVFTNSKYLPSINLYCICLNSKKYSAPLFHRKQGWPSSPSNL